jgi:hypothetical protein
MKEIIFVLCEGPHDIAFLYRILKTIGFESYKKKIGEYPEPIADFIKQSLNDFAIEDTKLDDLGKRPLPSEALMFENKLYLFYITHGDSKKERRRFIVENILKFKPEFIETDNNFRGLEAGDEINYSIAYFLDANNKGIDSRVRSIKAEISEFTSFKFTDKLLNKNGSVFNVKGIRFGIFVFSDNGKNGKLEDLLLPLMEKNNSEIFIQAENFLQLKDDNRLKKLEVRRNEQGKVFEKRSSKKMRFDSQKSKVCIAGQLQNSGKSNTVIIKDCDFITLEKINASKKCQEIIRFFLKFTYRS